MGKRVKKPVSLTKVLKDLNLPKPDHRFGYFYSTLQQHMDIREYSKFIDWMNGQTCALVEGKVVCYVEDVIRFLEMYRYDIPTYWD